MGNSPSISEPLPSSPIILVSIFVQPSILTFPVESTPELVITLHNPTAHPITFRFRQTPLDVPLCFGNVLYSGFWRIDDVTDHASSNNIPILTTPAHHGTLGAVPLATTGEAKSVRVVQEGDVLTVNPGKDGYKMSFSMKVQHGLETGKKYLFSMQDFDVEKGRWCYGSEKAALNAIRVALEQAQGGVEHADGRDKLKFKLLSSEGAVLETRSRSGLTGMSGLDAQCEIARTNLTSSRL